MGVATTTDTTDSVRTSFEIVKNLYGMSVQVNETGRGKPLSFRKKEEESLRGPWPKKRKIDRNKILF